ncbi:MAG TPA: acylphosphatase [Gammaproteobacteria bacterium]|nr:acylphosphatase [Gammaproteobacteria bacterium]
MSGTEEKLCVRCVVSGRVQGVFFRAAARDEARRLGLTGWVRNMIGGRVELNASGPHAAVDAFIAWLHRGPPAARVTAVDVIAAEDEGLSRFEIR